MQLLDAGGGIWSKNQKPDFNDFGKSGKTVPLEGGL